MRMRSGLRLLQCADAVKRNIAARPPRKQVTQLSSMDTPAAPAALSKSVDAQRTRNGNNRPSRSQHSMQL